MQSNFTSEEVAVQGEYLLQGTLTTPKDSEKKSPAVLVVAGSGEVDRDGNVSGIVLLAGAVETIEEALQRQRKLLYGELMGKKGVKGWLFRLLKIDQKGEKQALRVMEKIQMTPSPLPRSKLSIKTAHPNRFTRN